MAPVSSANPPENAGECTDPRPIGILDSGVGGLGLAALLRARLPSEPLLYYADRANAPYGGKPLERVREATLSAAKALRQRGIKLLVLACNTATSAAVEHLRRELPIPVVGMEPALKPAVARTRTRRVAVLATALTLGERKFADLAARTLGDVRLLRIAAPELVLEAEQGRLHGPRIEQLLRRLLQPALAQEADTIVLGCTHFALLVPAIRQLVGPTVTILDGNLGTARQVERVLRKLGLLAPPEHHGSITFLRSGPAPSPNASCESLFSQAQRIAELLGPQNDGTYL
jgi:glutamate racemase